MYYERDRPATALEVTSYQCTATHYVLPPDKLFAWGTWKSSETSRKVTQVCDPRRTTISNLAYRGLRIGIILYVNVREIKKEAAFEAIHPVTSYNTRD